MSVWPDDWDFYDCAPQSVGDEGDEEEEGEGELRVEEARHQVPLQAHPQNINWLEEHRRESQT